MFHREMLYLSRDRFDILRSELWELTQAFLDARRRGVFYQNTAFCFNYQRPCATLRCAAPTAIPTSLTTSISAWRPTRSPRVAPSNNRTGLLKEIHRNGITTQRENRTQAESGRPDGARLRADEDREVNLLLELGECSVPGHRARA